MLTLRASGSVSDYSDTSALQTSIAVNAGVDLSSVSISVEAASVIITATIKVPALTTADALQAKLTSRLGTAASASTALGITAVESDPTIVARDASAIGDLEVAEAGLGAGLGVGLGLPVFCAFLLFLHVRLNFAADKRGKYLKYRFSHTNRSVPCGFMPKDARDALWAEIKGTKASRVRPAEL